MKLKSKKHPLELFNELSTDETVCFLYSKEKSILATNPIETFSSQNNLEGFKKFAKKHKDKKLIGYFAYDIAYDLYDIKQTAKNDLKLPNIYFHAFKDFYEWNETEPIKIKDNKEYNSKNFKTTITKKAYTKAYNKIKNYIKEGDIYQINLTHRLEAETDMPARTLFTKVVEKNPAEFTAYLEGNGFEILSASPERFIKIENRKIETCPVKGTRPRGKTEGEDKKLVKELIESEKEAAELNMITDLLRNDTGKVCEAGSVKVEGHRLLSKCESVWHTYSRITGNIKKGTSEIEALISMLPGGSITGCPKKRAIEIIDELEKNTRGIYTGVIGYIDPNRNLDFNIAIRTIIKKNDKLFLQVGGGIVLDSVNKAEFEETLHKAASFMEIL